MPNRVTEMIQEIRGVEESFNRTRETPNRNWILVRLQKLKERLMAFGQKYPLVEIQISYFPYQGNNEGTILYGNEVTEIFYLTDCSDEEAVEYAKFRYHSHNINQLRVTRIPLASPIHK